MKKRFLLVFLAIVTVILSLVSCGGASSEETITKPSDSGTISSTVLDGDKIIYTVRYQIETLTINETVDAFEKAVADIGGYISSSSVTPRVNEETGYATYTLRIPSDKRETFSTTLAGFGNTVSRNVESEDITLKYTDTVARISSLEAEQARVMELYAAANSVSESLMIQSHLQEINTELTSLKQQLAVLDNKVDYATFYVTFNDVSEYNKKENFITRFGKSFVKSFTSFVKVAGEILIVLVYILPYALVVGVVGGVVLLILYYRKKHKK